MDFNILTLFPEMIEHAAGISILGRAVKNGNIKLNITNIRDFSANKHNRVDDYPYGGGAGMVIEAEPVFRAVKNAREALGEKTRVVYMTPQAKVLTQNMAEELAREKALIILCGHYEGIDERVLEEVVTDYISIGDYVLTGGELPALVLMDAVARFVPGVLSNEESSQFESMQDNLLEYPHYTRPQIWHDKEVPEELLSGDHERVNNWRFEQSLKRTQERRPDLLASYKKVFVMHTGRERSAALAHKVCEAVSRYGTILDYGRAKLQKQRHSFNGSDILIFVYDGDEPSNIIRNVRAEGTQVFIISANDCDFDDEVFDSTMRVFGEKGFLIESAYSANGKTESDFITETALDIRRRAGAVNRTE